MSSTPLTTFAPDPALLEPLRECMESYGVGDPDAEWPNNIISRKAVVYGNGAIARAGEPVRFAVDPAELARCQRLAAEAAGVMAGIDVGMGSESGDPFHPFFIAASLGEPIPAGIDAALIRARFGGTIFPPATITAEPLAETGTWWGEVTRYYEDSEPEDRDPVLARWRALIAWFQRQPDLTSSAFVRIGEYDALNAVDSADFPPGTEIAGCVLPRLALGLTRQGSLVGLFGYSVQT